MVEVLRGTADRGLLFANGGYATHNHTILLSGCPTDAQFPQDFDYQAEADRGRREIPSLDEHYSGPATVETYTVHYDRGGVPRSGVVIARTPEGARTLARTSADDVETIAFFTDGKAEPVGTSGSIHRNGDDIAIWDVD
nr:hypothetical protein [Erythrobacter sp. SN021]